MTTAAQLSVTDAPTILQPGQLFDLGNHDIVSKVCTEDVPFGVFVNISGDTCELPDTLGEANGDGGIALIDPTKGSPRDGLTVPGYKSGDVVRVLRRGRVCILAEEALAVGDTLFVRYATGTGTQKGAFRNDADTTTAGTPANIKLFKAHATLPVVEINTP
jgi:hypothetical protein